MKEQDRGLVTGIAWYRQDQWSQLRDASADPDVLEKTYEEWLSVTHRAIVDFASEGIRTKRVALDVGELVEWCRSNKRPLDSSARAEFTTRKLKRKREPKA